MTQPEGTKKEINTFIFLDTETTGLPSPGNKTRITEISLLAYSQNELLYKTKWPRVCNKLTFCFDPCRPIQPLASEVSGLHNDALEGLPTFKKQSPLIISFLKSLPAPVCLVAHNGNNFDFPLLKAELKISRCQEDIETILCADSLWAFRNLDGLPAVPPAHSNLKNKQNPSPQVGASEKDHSSDVKTNNLNNGDSADVVNTNLHENSSTYSSPVPGLRELEITPEKSQVGRKPPNLSKRGSSDIHHPESLAKKRLFVAEPESSNNSSQTVDKDTIPVQTDTCHGNGANSVNNSPASQNYVSQQKSSKSYSLPRLYKYYFGQEPDVSHTAEDDCITLMKIVRLKAKEFIWWCNQNSTPFKNVNPMY